MIIKCTKCNKQIGEVIKGGFSKSSICYCKKCGLELQAKAIYRADGDLTDNFFGSLFGGKK